MNDIPLPSLRSRPEQSRPAKTDAPIVRVVGYVRVSTDAQAASGLSLEAQTAAIERYCASQGWTLADIHSDAESASELDRPGLTAALASLSDLDVDGLVVTKLDRLTRSVRDWATLVDEHFGDAHGERLVSIGEQVDTSTAAGRMMLGMIILVAQWERGAIAERTGVALQRRKANGASLGAPRFGRRWQGGEHVECHRELAILALARQLRDAGLSQGAIADALNDRDLRNRRGRPWTQVMVSRILR